MKSENFAYVIWAWMKLYEFEYGIEIYRWCMKWWDYYYKNISKNFKQENSDIHQLKIK